MTTTKIWVEKKLVLDETADFDVDADRTAASAKTLDVINRARRAKQDWRVEIFEPHAPANHRTWFQTSNGEEGWIPDEGGYLGTALRLLGLVAATALLLLPFFVFDLVVILLVLAAVSIVRTRRLRRAQATWRAQPTRRIRP